jgi:hypothetical protein
MCECFLRKLNSGLYAYKAGAIQLKPHLQSILLWLFWTWGLANYLPGLNRDLPELSLPSSWDYMCEQQASAGDLFLRQSLTLEPMLALNLKSTCLSFLSIGITGLASLREL